MDNKKVIALIKDLISSILENSCSHVEIEKKINEIHEFFKNITSITGYDQNIEYLAAVPTARGKALGLNHAAQCLLDYKRTVKFVKSIVIAILDKQKANPGELVNVFYAGCGPYATLMTLVAPFFKPEEVQFSLLEINQKSLNAAKTLIESLNLSNYIQEYYLADAITFKVPNSSSYNILISETLDALLYRECYVPILFNLLPQFSKNITLIPENVLVDVFFVPYKKQEIEKEEAELTNVINVRELISLYGTEKKMPSKLDVLKLDFTSLDMNLYEKLVLDTKVHVYNNIWLDRNASSLTLSLEMGIEKPFKKESMSFTYFLEPEIELKCTID